MSVGHWVALLRAGARLFAVASLLVAAKAAEPATGAAAEYRAILWVGSSLARQPARRPLFFQRLREMGINAVTVHGDADAGAFVAEHFAFYVENVVNRGLCLKFNSDVRDWDRFIRGWMEGGRPASALVRPYSLDDPAWRAWARTQMETVARQSSPARPLAYDIRDELSTTISANPFDYDFSPPALAGFRAWLKTQYADLGGLNRVWATSFADWTAVTPFTTDQIKARTATGAALPHGPVDWAAVRRWRFDPDAVRRDPARWSLAPWMDFRTYMDVSLARTLGELRDAAHAVDPATPVGIEGTQMPSAFGGYDLWRLAQVLDWMEPYDIGNAREILGSFMPGRLFLTTVFEKDTPHARRRLWHLLLEGDGGCIVWWSEDVLDWQSETLALTPKGRALAPVLHEMQSRLAGLFRRAQRESDPIYLVYSQPSLQVDWLLESAADGATWPRRFSSFEAGHNQLAQRRAGWLKLFQDMGYTPQFVAAERLRAVVTRDSPAVVVLSDALALAPDEAAAAAEFARGARRGDHLLQDAPAGVFDQHGCIQSAPTALGSTFAAGTIRRWAGGEAQSLAGDMADFGRRRKTAAAAKYYAWFEAARPFAPPIVVAPETHTRIHRYRSGAGRLVAFERDIDYHMSEDLKEAGGNEALEQPIDLEARLSAPAHVYDLQTLAYLGRVETISFRLDPWHPSCFALLPQKLPDGADLLTELERRR